LEDQGLGCAHSASMAVSWYRKAADAGNAMGENNLADMYLRGEGVPQNNAEAFRLFQKAAIQGSTGARIKLGYMYANGLGVKKDPETAYAWISAASMAGDRRGDYLIPALKELLSAQQISAASQKAESAPFRPDQQLPISSFAP
jgi:TPR repeat protein